MQLYYVGPLPVVIAGWLLAALLAGVTIFWLAGRAGLRPWQSAAVFASVVAAVLIGSKMLYLLEAGPNWLSTRMDATNALFSAKMRIPGGLVLAVAIGPAVAWLIRARYLPLFDAIVPAAGLCIVGVRLGCLLAGCCFGTPSSLPWAMRFPRYGEAYWWQLDHGIIAEDAAATAPVHPLQAYFGIAGIVIFAGLLAYQRHKRYEGEIILLFLLLFLWSTWFLELFRAVPHEFTHRAVLVGGIAVTALAAAIEWRRRREAAAVLLPGRPPSSS